MAEENTETKGAAETFTLRGIYFRTVETKLLNDFDPLAPGQQLSAFFRNTDGTVDCRETTVSDGTNSSLIHSCAFNTGFEFAYVLMTDGEAPSDEDREKATVALISAYITADYLVPGPSFPEQNVLTGWATTNALLHCWPYWREFCQSTMLRMNLPVTTIPLLRLQHKV